MPRIDISRLPDEARIWIFGISPAVDDARGAALLGRVDAFLDEWAAHGQPITSARDLLFGSFLVIAVDRQSETSGCSIDRMFHLLQELERDYATRILDPDRVFVRGGDGGVRAVSRAEFSSQADPHTDVFDVLAERLGEIRSGRWERPAKDSWHRALLRPVAIG